MKHSLFTLVFLAIFSSAFGQSKFSENPLDAKFVLHDYNNFWKQFDKMSSSNENPFGEYLKNASIGLQPYVGYFNVDSLYQKVQDLKEDYLKSRPILQNLDSKKKKIQASYAAMKYWYPKAVFPPIYFVVADFSTGGTISDQGLLIGSEKLKSLDGLNGLVSHELIHFQQNFSKTYNLLNQSIKEGSADFLGELISGEHINMTAFAYGEQHEHELCKEFVSVMYKEDFTDWLYGTSGKDDRPNDLGYWIGYKITEAYFNKQEDKQQAVLDILNVQNPVEFLKKSGYLDTYMQSQD